MEDNKTILDKKILIVDDEKGLRNLYFIAITPLGYPVETAENGEEALEKIYSKNLTLI